jgi:hypothetical protein
MPSNRWIAILPAIAATSAQATDWLQFGYDEAHSGNNRAENGYSTAAGNTTLYHYALPSSTADSTPVYVEDVSVAGGTKSVLFTFTNNGTLYALDADSKTLNVLWSKQPTGASKTTRGWGSPAIDPNRQYVYAYGFDGKVHKYGIGDGAETNTGGWPELVTNKAGVEKGASSLAIATVGASHYLYHVMDGYIGDGGDYQGHLTTIDLAAGAQKVFNTLCSDKTIHFDASGGANDCSSARNGIWGRPGAIYDAGTNRVFIATGNGPFSPANHNWGDSVLALSADGSGSGGNPVDSYTPSTFANLEGTDADLGSNSLALVPAPAGSSFTHLGVIAGKDDCVRLIRLDNMSGHGAPGNSGGSLQSQRLDTNVSATNCDDTSASGGSDGNNGEIRAQPAVWVNPADGSTWVYISNRGSTLVAYKVTLTGGTPSLTQQWTAGPGTSPILANGTLYYLTLSGANTLTALNAVTGSLIWQSAAVSSTHWQSPILVNGRMYLTDDASPSQLWAFQLDGIFRNGFQ